MANGVAECTGPALSDIRLQAAFDLTQKYA